MTPFRPATVPLTLAILLPFWSLLVPDEARAHACARVYNVTQQASRVISRVSAEINAMEAAVVEALRLQTGQLSGYQAKSARALAGALDSQTRLQAQIAREVEEARALDARRPASGACAAITGLRGLGPSRAAAAEAERVASRVESGRIAADRAQVPAAGAPAANAARFERLTALYCNQGRAATGADACRGKEAMHGADLDPAALFGPSTLATAGQRAVARDLARNITAPVVHEPPPLAAADTGEERRRVLLARAADARQALAAASLAEARARRLPAAGLAQWAAAVVPAIARDPDVPLSRHELLEILSLRRFEDPNWFTALQALSTDNLLREIVILLAVSSMMDWERYRLAERGGAIAAAGLAGEAEAMRRLPELARPAAGAN